MRMWRIALASAALATTAGAAGAPNTVPNPPAISSKSFILMDADTRHIVAELDSNKPLPPASLTKIMTSYVAASELAAGRVKANDEVPVSVKAWRTGGSKMFIREGTTVSLENLLRGIVIQSGNDASVAVAEYIGGDENGFANMMNAHAEELGLANSQFTNATGLPDDNHYSSTRDMAVLTAELIARHPDHYAMYRERSFEYGGIRQANRNRLLWRDQSADGVKTGLTDAAGYCLVASARRDGTRFIVATMGARTDDARFSDAQKLLAYGFRYYESQSLYDADEVVATRRVWYGVTDSVTARVREPVRVTIPRGRFKDLDAVVDLPAHLEAPVAAAEPIGFVRITLAGEVLAEAPLTADIGVEEAGVFSKMGDWFYLLFRDLLGLADPLPDATGGAPGAEARSAP